MSVNIVFLSNVGPLQTTLLGMGTVFIVLLILMFAIKIMTKVFGDKPKAQESKPAAVVPQTAPVVTPSSPQEDEEELIAVLTAAVMAATNNEKIITLRSFRAMGNPLPTWTKSGVEEMMR